MEGGGPTLTCIARYQNNMGGIYLQRFYADVGGLAQNAPFVIRMDTCDYPATPVSYPQGQQPPMSKRQATSGLSMQGAEAPVWVRDPRTESEGYVFMPLSDSSPGNYSGTLSFSDTAGLQDISIVDGSGELLWNNTGTWISGTRDVKYQVQDDTQDLCVAAKAVRSVDVSASFTATAVLAKASGGPASGAWVGSRVRAWSVVGGVLVGVWWT